MKLCTLLFLASLGLHGIAYGQRDSSAKSSNMPAIGCIDKALRIRAEDVKNMYVEQQGMKVTRDAMLTMKSGDPFLIEVKLNKDRHYQMVFMGVLDATETIFELFDYNDKPVTHLELEKKQQPHYLSYAFSPSRTAIYTISLTQILRNRTLCGSFTILELPEEPEPQAPTPPPAATEDTSDERKP
jgi:hypothetical protein